MPQNFITQLERVRRRSHRRFVVTVSCWALTALLTDALVFIGLDRLLGVGDTLGRVVCSALFGAWTCWIARSWAVATFQHCITPQQVAKRVEDRYPQLRDVVSSALDFSGQEKNDPLAGSESLRRAVVLRATTGLQDVEWQQFVPRKSLHRASLAVLGASLFLMVLSWWAPLAVGIGFSRLLNPLNDAQWPRDNNLHFVNPPLLLAAGQNLVVEVRDSRSPLPDSVLLHYRWWRNNRWHEETKSFSTNSGAVMALRSQVQESLQFRATGGDHQNMPWHKLEVVAPTRINLLQVTVHPPVYTGRSSHQLNENSAVLAGSFLEVNGEVDQLLAAAVLCGGDGFKVPVKLEEGSKTIHIEADIWQAERSGEYWFELTTKTGLSVRAEKRIILKVVPDHAPQVIFVEPDRDLFVLPNATVDFAVEAHDDVAIQSMELVYRRSDRSEAGDYSRTLLSIPRSATGKVSPRKHRVETTWQLGSLDVKPGSILEVHARATDYQPASGQTAYPLRLSIVSEEEFWQRFAEGQQRVFEIISGLLDQQRELRLRTVGWQDNLSIADQPLTNESHAALFAQRQISSALGDGPVAVLDEISAMLVDLESNQYVRHDIGERLQSVDLLLRAATQEILSPIERNLTDIIRQSQQNRVSSDLSSLLKTLGQEQQKAVAAFEEAIRRLAVGKVLTRFEKELTSFIAAERRLAQHCQNDLMPEMLQAKNDFTRAHVDAQLSAVTNDQRQLARQFSDIIMRMLHAAETMKSTGPDPAGRLIDTIALSQKLKVQVTMHSVSGELAEQRVSNAIEKQQQVLKDLEKLKRRLTDSDAEESGERLEQLRAAEIQLENLRRQTADLGTRLHESFPLQAVQQRDVATEAELHAKTLDRLRVIAAASSTRQAAKQLRSTPSDRDAIHEAEQKLVEANRYLSTERRRLQVALARRQLAELVGYVYSILNRQQDIDTGMDLFEKFRGEQGRLDAEQLELVATLGTEQKGLSEEVVKRANDLTQLPVFSFQLRTTSENMQRLARRLQQRRTDKATRELSRQVLAQLEWLAGAVKEEQKSLRASHSPSAVGAAQSSQGDQAQYQSLQLILGQLRLLKSMQADLRQRTEALEETNSSGEIPTLQLQAATRELAREQSQLIRLVRELAHDPLDSPEVTP